MFDHNEHHKKKCVTSYVWNTHGSSAQLHWKKLFACSWCIGKSNLDGHTVSHHRVQRVMSCRKKKRGYAALWELCSSPINLNTCRLLFTSIHIGTAIVCSRRYLLLSQGFLAEVLKLTFLCSFTANS